MKKLFLLSAFLIAAVTVNAQSTRTQSADQINQDPIAKAKKQTEKFHAIVNLTDAQKIQAEQINLEKNKEIQIAAQSPSTFEAEKLKINTVRKQALYDLLTPEQKTKAEKSYADKQARKAAGTKK